MPKPCPICTHPKRLAIDREIISGTSILKISRKYGQKQDPLYQHAKNHLSRQLVQAYEKKALSESMDLLGMIEDILIKAKAIFDRNFEAKKDVTALKALSEQRATIELLSKIAAYLHESRAMELQTATKGYEVRRQEEERDMAKTIIDNLNSAEADMFIQLLEKGQGLTNKEIIPMDEFIWEDEDVEE